MWEDFTVKDGMIYKYLGNGGDVVLPEGITGIKEAAFSHKNSLKSIKIPNGVKRIGKSAFSSCKNLECIELPRTLTNIGEGAFSYSEKLRNITIPKSVRKIGGKILNGCTELENINVEAGNPIYHSEGNCLIETAEKTLIAGCRNSVIPTDGSVTCIGEDAFCHCRTLQSITIPESVTTIGCNAFLTCKSLKQIIIPNHVTKIDQWAFMHCEGLESVVISDSVTDIGECAFWNCQNLQEISIGNHCEKLIRNIFPMEMKLRRCVCAPELKDEKQCKMLWEVLGLRNLMLPFLLGTIETNEIILKKLQSQIKIKKFREECIPKWIERNEAEAVAKLLSLVKKMSAEEIDGYIEKSERVPEIRMMLMEYKNRLYPAEVLDQMEEIRMEKDFGLMEKTLADYRRDFKIFKEGNLYKITGYKSENETVIIPGTIKGIPVSVADEAFFNCNKIKDVLIEEGAIAIGNDAFRHCKNLQSVLIPESVTEIGERAFYGCESLADSKGRIIIRDILFGYCGSKTEFEVPEGIAVISSEAFRDCKLLQNIRIPASVKRIGDSVFRNCINLQSISVSEENPFYRVENNCLIDKVKKVLLAGFGNSVIPADGSVTEIGKYAFHWRKGLKNIVIPDGVTSIGNFAFQGCEGLESVKLSNGLKRIGDSSFYGCTNLQDITLPEGLTDIGRWAFCMCGKHHVITIPQSVTNIGLEAFFSFGYANCEFICSAGSYAETYAKKNHINFQIKPE